VFGLIWIECGIKMVVIGCRNWYIGMNIGNECGDNEGMIEELIASTTFRHLTFSAMSVRAEWECG